MVTQAGAVARPTKTTRIAELSPVEPLDRAVLVVGGVAVVVGADVAPWTDPTGDGDGEGDGDGVGVGTRPGVGDGDGVGVGSGAAAASTYVWNANSPASPPYENHAES